MKRSLGLMALLAALFTAGCSTPYPEGFQPLPPQGWTVLEMRQDIPFEHAWTRTVELLAKDFDLETLSREDGYIRTAWCHTWNGVYLPQYRVRVTVLFPENRKTVRIKPEAQAYVEREGWMVGTDERLLPALKSELLGSLGRTLR